MYKKLDWSSKSREAIDDYKAKSEMYLSNVKVLSEALLCKDCSCHNKDDADKLITFYNDVMNCLKLAAQDIAASKNISPNKFNRRGWNEFLPHICIIPLSAGISAVDV